MKERQKNNNNKKNGMQKTKVKTTVVKVFCANKYKLVVLQVKNLSNVTFASDDFENKAI